MSKSSPSIPPSPAVSAILREIHDEYASARRRFSAFNSSHEAYGVVAEEFEEWWDEIKANNPAAARKEAIQLAAMVLSYLIEVAPRA